ncbi:type II toxin-antitoxin system HicA family toxin [Aurantimicrobium photophilum]
MRAREVNSRIESLGGQFLRQKGSHRLYRITREGVSVMAVVPQHGGDIPIGTLRAIERSLEEVLGKGWLR